MNSAPAEILALIVDNFTSIRDNISLKLTSKYLNISIAIDKRNEVSSLECYIKLWSYKGRYDKFKPDDFSTDFIKEHMDKNWYPYYLSRSPNINDDIVRINSDFPWIYEFVWRNKTISLEYAYELFLRKGSHLSQFYHPSITIDFILSNLEVNFDWRILSSKLPMSDILAHPELPWNLSHLQYNDFLTPEIVKSNPHIQWKFSSYCNKEVLAYLVQMKLDTTSKSYLSQLYIELLLKHDSERINLDDVGRNINDCAFVDRQFFIDHIDHKCWDFDVISKYVNDDNFDIVNMFLHKPWNWKTISSNVSWNTIVSNPTLNWNWKRISASKHITLNIVTSNPDYPWSTLGLSFNLHLTIDYVLANMKKFKPYMRYVSFNTGISLEDINTYHKIRWSWKLVSIRPDVNILSIFLYRNIKWNNKVMITEWKSNILDEMREKALNK